MAQERIRSIDEITDELEGVQAISAQAHAALEARRKELMQAQTVAIDWNPDYPSPHAASILAFAQEHDLDPIWLGDKVGRAMLDARSWKRRVRADKCTTSEDYYGLAMTYLNQDHYADGPFLRVARDAFNMAFVVAVIKEESNPDLDLRARDTMFYKFLAENFAGALKQIVHDDYWNNY